MPTQVTGLETRLNRRTFARLAGATALLGLAPVVNVAYGAALTKAQRDSLTPDQIVAHMKQGNERFRLGRQSKHDYLAQQERAPRVSIPLR